MKNGTTADQNQDGRGFPTTRIETIAGGSIDPARVRYTELDSDGVERWRIREGDILLSHINSVEHIGKSAIYKGYPEILIHGMNLLLLRPDSRLVMPEYLHYGLRSKDVREHIRARCKRAINQASINQKELGAIQMPVPPLDEQRHIVDLLARAEGIVRLRHEAEKKAAELIPALFLDMFGDPATNPKGWPLIRLGESESRVQIGPFGSLLHKEDYISGGVPLINPMHIIKGRIEPGTEQTVREEKAAELFAYRLAAGDVVMGRRGEMGRCAIVSPLEAGMLCGTGSLFIRPAPTEFSPVFLSAVLSSAQMKQHLESVSQGVTLANLNRSMIEALQIPIPPMALQQSFARRVQDAESIQSQQSAATAKAQETFDALLGQVFSA